MKKFILFVVALATCFISCNKEKEAQSQSVADSFTFRLHFDCDLTDAGESLISAYYDAVGLDANTIGDQYEDFTVTAKTYDEALIAFKDRMKRAENVISPSLKEKWEDLSVSATYVTSGEQVYFMQYGASNGEIHPEGGDEGDSDVWTFTPSYNAHFDQDYAGGNLKTWYVKDICVDHFYNKYGEKKLKGHWHSRDLNHGSFGSDYVFMSVHFTPNKSEAITDAFIAHGARYFKYPQKFHRTHCSVGAVEADYICTGEIDNSDPNNLANIDLNWSHTNPVPELHIYYTKDPGFGKYMKAPLLYDGWWPRGNYRTLDEVKLKDKWKVGNFREYMPGTEFMVDPIQLEFIPMENREKDNLNYNKGMDCTRGTGSNHWIFIIPQWEKE